MQPTAEAAAVDRIDKLKTRLREEITAVEKRADLTAEEKVNRIRHATCALCAGLAVQPIPFADMFILTPLQGYMGVKIAQIHGLRISEQGALEILKELGGLIGLGFVAQQAAIGAYKTFIPFLGALTTIPMVYGLTYAIGTVMDYYFREKVANRPIDRKRIRQIWRAAKRAGKKDQR